jgi:hypothetical protein
LIEKLPTTPGIGVPHVREVFVAVSAWLLMLIKEREF